MPCSNDAERPLQGRRVVVTRAASQSGSIVRRLESVGAEPIEVPTIVIVDPLDGGAALRAAVHRIDAYDWVVVASRNAALRFVDCVERERPMRPLRRLAAVGPGTASELRRAGLGVDLVPDRNDAEGLVEAFPAANGTGRVLIPRAEQGRDVLVRGLTDKQWRVDAVVAYRTLRVVGDPALGMVARGADAIAFTSSSTVLAFVAAYGRNAVPPVVVSIGPATTATAVGCGLVVTTTASPSTLDGLVAAVVEALARPG